MPAFRAPARISLNVRVVGKHNDGSPDYVALNQTVDLCDILHADHAENDQFPADYPEIQKAVEAYRNVSNDQTPVVIQVESRIPQHAGLGISHSRMATVLWALNQLSANPIEEQELVKLAANIHPDVGFFFSRGTARCSGEEGRIIEEQETSGTDPYWLVCSPYQLSTENIYRRFSVTDLQDRELGNSLENLMQGSDAYINDLEESVFALNPRLALLKQRIKEKGFNVVVMSGTDPSFICMDGPSDLELQENSYQIHPLNRRVGHWY